MTNLIKRYNQRFNKYNIDSCNTVLLKEILNGENQKFHRDGRPKQFYGLTCIAWINKKNELFYNLTELQNKIKESLESEGYGRYFSFLAPQSLHMTICDIESCSEPISLDRINTRIKQLSNVFKNFTEPPECVESQIKGLGLKETITALVRFDQDLEPELKKVLYLEEIIKNGVKVNEREFTGHISMAYLVRYPGSRIKEIKKILLSCAKYRPEEFCFSQFDLAYFTNMNKYIPIMTIDLENRKLMSHRQYRNAILRNQAKRLCENSI